VSPKNPRQGFVAGSLAGMLEVESLAGEQVAEAIRRALEDPRTLEAVQAELAEAEQRLDDTPRASPDYVVHEREVSLLRNVLALRQS
jgi:hypothetical protein